MKLKDFMKLHAKDFNYEILLKRISKEGNVIHLDYADNIDSPWERYFCEYFDWNVEYFKIEIFNGSVHLVIYINFKSEA